jgi:apolipoprotein N-acyltransferase
VEWQLVFLGLLSQRIKRSSGWRRAIIAFGAGAISAVALPPLDLWPILFVTLTILIWLIDGSATKRWGGIFTAAGIGWLFGFGYFLGGLYWFGYAYHYLVQTTLIGWLLPIAVMIIPACLAIYAAFGLALARLIWSSGSIRVVSLAASLTIAEWLRGHLVTDFPWNTLGYALTGPLVLAQSAAWVGIWGLTFFAVLIFASPAVLADDQQTTRRRWLPAVGGLLLLAALALAGAVRLSQHPTENLDSVRLRLVQPNQGWESENLSVTDLRNLLKLYRTLSSTATPLHPQGLNDVTHLLWPEDALPFYRLSPEMMSFLPHNAVLVTGALRLTDRPNNAGIGAYNSLFVVDHDAKVIAFYDKIHLVPFGEYLPFRAWLEKFGLMRFVKSSGELLRGNTRSNLATPDAPDFLPLICYEVIFPNEVMPRGERPGWIVNLTNDGWFGDSAGPYQHFQQARVRAIEQGLPLVRVANTGISAIVDPLGRIVESLPLDTEGVIDGTLPRALPPTFYATYGDDGVAAMLGLALLAAGLRYGRHRASFVKTQRNCSS